MNKKLFPIILFVILITIFIVGCGSNVSQDTTKSNANELNEEQEDIGLSLDKQKEIYYELVKLEDAVPPDDPNYNDKINEAKVTIMERYGITKDKLNKMSYDAFKNNWPMPDLPETDIELSDEENEILVKVLLTSYGYTVLNVMNDYSDALGDYSIVGMISEGTTEEEVAIQVGAGIGALYGSWEDKDYYAVALNNGIDICTFGIMYNDANDYMTGKTTDLELFLSIESVCVPV